MLFSLIALTLIYGVLMVFELKLIMVYSRGGVVSAMPEIDKANYKPTVDKSDDDVLSFAY